MKSMKKVFAILLAVVMVMGLSVTAFADTEKGSITVENATIGQTYTAYKVFDLTYVEKYTEATYTEGSTETYYTYDETTSVYTEVADPSTATEQLYVKGYNVSYTYTKTGDTDALYTALTGTDSPFTLTATTTENVYNVSTTSDAATIASFLKGLVDNGTLTTTIIAITPTQDSQEVKFTNLDLGYYFITSSLGAVVTIDSTTPDVTVIDKNTQEPTIPEGGLKTIEVEDAEGNKTYVDATSASVGDILNFRIQLNTVNWVTKKDETTGETTTEQVTKYTITDTPTDMTIDQTSVVVKVGDTVLTAPTSTTTGAYTLTFDETTGKMTVVVPWVDDDGNSLYANGAVLEVTYKAEVTAVAVDGNATNNATASYNESTPLEDKVEVYTFPIDVVKVDGGSKPLTGAQFELYDAATGGNKINLVAVMDTTDSTKVAYYRPATPEEVKAEDFTSAVIEAGNVTVKGLAAGTYYLEEIKAPEGYNMLTSRVKVEISYTTSESEGTTTVTANYKVDDTDQGTTDDITIKNTAGTELPSTGGIGTTIFYVVGSILVIGAAVLLITKKRMNGTAE